MSGQTLDEQWVSAQFILRFHNSPWSVELGSRAVVEEDGDGLRLTHLDFGGVLTITNDAVMEWEDGTLRLLAPVIRELAAAR